MNCTRKSFLPSSQELGVVTVLWPVIYHHVSIAFLAKIFELLSFTCFEIGCCKSTAEDVKLKQTALGCWWEYRVTRPKLFYLLRRQVSDVLLPVPVFCQFFPDLLNITDWKGPQKTFWSNILWEREPGWDNLASCPVFPHWLHFQGSRLSTGSLRQIESLEQGNKLLNQPRNSKCRWLRSGGSRLHLGHCQPNSLPSFHHGFG